MERQRIRRLGPMKIPLPRRSARSERVERILEGYRKVTRFEADEISRTEADERTPPAPNNEKKDEDSDG